MLLLRNADVDGLVGADVLISGGRVVDVGERLTADDEFDCAGGAVIPGLCDHHLHLHAMAAHAASVACGPPAVRDRAGLTAALATANPDTHGWIRGVGYVESVAGSLDATTLDVFRADVPIRIQHRSGALWMLNTAAVAAVGAAESRLWRADTWLRSRLPAGGMPDLSAVGAALSRAGITSVTDATPDLDATVVAAMSVLPFDVQLLGVPLGVVLPASGPKVGPYKIVLADSGLPSYDDLVDRIRTAHAINRPVAVHCVTREALLLLLAALRAAGPLPGDRIEHAALIPAEVIGDLARLGVRVVTQPGFIADRGDDFLLGVPENEHQDLYRCATLQRAGIPIALSSDAPYGPLDPWKNISAATSRRTASGQPAGLSERLTFRQALDAYLSPADDPGGPPRRVRPGSPADLVILRSPLAQTPGDPDPVRAVVRRGQLVLT